MVLNLNEKVKPGFLHSLYVSFLNRMGQNLDSTAFTSEIQVFCRLEWTKVGTPWKGNLTFFKYKNDKHFWQNFQITNRAQKVDEKNRVICLVSFFPSWVMVLKLLKIVYFFQICADLRKKSKSIKAIYLYPSERPHHVLLENNMFYKGLSNSSRDIEK